MKTHVVRLLPNMDLKKSLQRLVEENNIEAGWVLTCVGSLVTTNIRFANGQEGTANKGHFEILSLVGTLSINGSHLHITVGDENGSVSGGHLLDGNLIYTTAEIVIAESPDLLFKREKDGSTNWPELHIYHRMQ